MHRGTLATLVAVSIALATTGAQAACVGGAPNGKLEVGEQCDDGNTINTDGCLTNCTIPPTCEGAQTLAASDAPPTELIDALLQCYAEFAGVFRDQVLATRARGTTAPASPLLALFTDDVGMVVTKVGDLELALATDDISDFAAAVRTSGLLDETVAVKAQLNSAAKFREKAKNGLAMFEGLNRGLTRLVDRAPSTAKHDVAVLTALLDVLTQLAQITSG